MAKKAANTAAMKFNELKKTFNESLIWLLHLPVLLFFILFVNLNIKLKIKKKYSQKIGFH